jgi:hypothetical protein
MVMIEDTMMRQTFWVRDKALNASNISLWDVDSLCHTHIR